MDLEENDMPVDLTTRPITRRRSSFFNMPLRSKDTVNKEIGIKKENYIEKLETEEKNWAHLIRKYNKKFLVVASQLPIEYDLSMISEDRQDYLNQAVDEQIYLNNFDEFQKRVTRYIMRKEWINKRLDYFQEQIDEKMMEVAISKLSH